MVTGSKSTYISFLAAVGAGGVGEEAEQDSVRETGPGARLKRSGVWPAI